jgi:hypothetical protein
MRSSPGAVPLRQDSAAWMRCGRVMGSIRFANLGGEVEDGGGSVYEWKRAG